MNIDFKIILKIHWRMKNYLIVFFTFLFTLQTFGQQLTGTVEVDGEPIPGVNIINNTTGNGTLTDFDGNFSIDNISEGDEIEFSYIGFTTQRIVYNGQTSLNISLEESSEKLEEVIVTGYGSQIAKNLSSSIVRVDGENVKNTALGSFEQALQGRAPGVTVTNAGAPGTTPNVRIRGLGTFGNNDPLYVVDGVIDVDTAPPDGPSSIPW